MSADGMPYAGPWAGVYPAPAVQPSVALAPRALRRLLGHYPTGVAIATTRDARGKLHGLTINSFVPVSLQPPLVSWTLALHSNSLKAFQRAPQFAISVLGAQQVALARQFADPLVRDRFEGVALLDEEDDLPPRIAGAVAHLVCSRHAHWPVGDHLLLVGRVLQASDADQAPLLFHRGRFQAGSLQPVFEVIP
ncbi:flavin reductase [Stenotrophomonas sp. ZAC14D2_NAIMI4_7]|uniref:flavin reductase family protein n=1 Tax=Stenotrophomonas sp. ZAC14D2_NAIMI4_7 TaxID=2072405 RepID=UPI000D53E7D2|nr:flavin reductase family protein [Stenotrophomonas sp. ZAC14D2_NAIMI4_7]AWH17815.1 flavin reductase [Stenotrophomonas sp. ZAC14D2_NAIMI4_7]